MGRYSSVQAFADNNANLRKVSYDQVSASVGSESKGLGEFLSVMGLCWMFISGRIYISLLIPFIFYFLFLFVIIVKPEKVVNAYGSTAGAGSGEFHVYRHARERELGRLRQLDEIEEEQNKESKYQQTLHFNKMEEEKKTDKNRKKRQREKESKLRKRNLEKVGIFNNNNATTTTTTNNDEIDDKEFGEYIPLNQNSIISSKNQSKNDSNDDDDAKPKAALEQERNVVDTSAMKDDDSKPCHSDDSVAKRLKES